MKALEVGGWAKIAGPHGKFTFEGEYEKIALLSGGVGITPLRSICRYCADTQLPTKITLLYGNRSERDILFRREFEEMQEQNKNFRAVFCVGEASEAWDGYTGVINAEMIRKEMPDYIERVFYICGPPTMVKVMEDLLRNLEVPEESIRVENFTGY